MASSSSRGSTPIDDVDMRGIFAAMAEESPVATARTAPKRTHQAMTGDDGEASDDDTARVAPPLALGHQNTIATLKRYGEKKRIRAEQNTELETFVKDPGPVREAKLFVLLFTVLNEVNKIVKAAPVYEVSADLEKNINNYVFAVLVSDKISEYKGDGPKTIVLALLKKYPFDIPNGIEKIPADYAKLVSAVGEGFTQKRSKIKKAVRRSVGKNKDEDKVPPAASHQNIFTLAQNVKGTQCTVTIVLCARLALMRHAYLTHPGKNFWTKLDDKLAGIREQAAGDAKKLTKAFRHILQADRDKHGSDDYTLDDTTVDAFQEDVDSVIEATTIDRATTAGEEDVGA
ncbi:hypothetical protein B0H16DRAFT_1808822 [Mycena metata]|uniref:Uncharacterized protein n=1 Tax=Mycena metata TaxID=1033252 RepID=A0AAD7JCW3_9AGAR|nr:hypothetical protein B0H16DRAFT_1808822 [Mycena metata]